MPWNLDKFAHVTPIHYWANSDGCRIGLVRHYGHGIRTIILLKNETNAAIVVFMSKFANDWP